MKTLLKASHEALDLYAENKWRRCEVQRLRKVEEEYRAFVDNIMANEAKSFVEMHAIVKGATND